MIGVNLRHIQRSVAAIALAAGAAFGVSAGAECTLKNTLFSPCEGSVNAELLILPSEIGITTPAAARRITVTGTYSSGDRFGIEGLALKDGVVVSARFQKWDGGLLIDADGRTRIVNVSRLSHGGKTYDLKDKADRRAFLNVAKTEKTSFIQSHLLITDGNLDTRKVDGARKFQRRILYSDATGALSLYDSGARSLTLYEAALELHRDHGAHMALNLDMGSYDFCQIEAEDQVNSCGILASAQDARLTNLLRFTIY